MRPFIILIALACFSMAGFAQKPLVIKVEKLKKPDKLLPVNAYEDILKDLIRVDHGVHGFPPAKQAQLDPKFNIIAKSNVSSDLVSPGFGTHPFFNGMYTAYADHRPFTLSPDMIWLLICQGFAAHVIVELGIKAISFGHTSLTLACEVRNKITQKTILTIDKIVFVSLDENGKPIRHGRTAITYTDERLRE